VCAGCNVQEERRDNTKAAATAAISAVWILNIKKAQSNHTMRKERVKKKIEKNKRKKKGTKYRQRISSDAWYPRP
jgi:hypothetical protein